MVLQQEAHPIYALEQVATLEELLTAQRVLSSIYVNDLVRAYVVDIVRATREHPDIYLGASPRGSLALFKTARAWAALEGRDFVTPDDIKALAGPVLAHRLIASPSARIRGVDASAIVTEILGTTAVPGTDAAVN